MTTAERVLESLKTIINEDGLTDKYNKCLSFIEKNCNSSVRNDRVVNYTFSDNSVLTEFNEEDYGGSVTWSINDYEDFTEIQFNDYEDED